MRDCIKEQSVQNSIRAMKQLINQWKHGSRTRIVASGQVAGFMNSTDSNFGQYIRLGFHLNSMFVHI